MRKILYLLLLLPLTCYGQYGGGMYGGTGTSSFTYIADSTNGASLRGSTTEVLGALDVAGAVAGSSTISGTTLSGTGLSIAGNMTLSNAAGEYGLRKANYTGNHNFMNFDIGMDNDKLGCIMFGRYTKATVTTNYQIVFHKGDSTWNPGVVLYPTQGKIEATQITIPGGVTPAGMATGTVWTNGDSLLWYDGSNVRWSTGTVR